MSKKLKSSSENVTVNLVVDGEVVSEIKVNNLESKSDINDLLNGLMRIASGAFLSASMFIMENENMEPSVEKLKAIALKVSGHFSDNVSEFINESIDKVVQVVDDKNKKANEDEPSLDDGEDDSLVKA